MTSKTFPDLIRNLPAFEGPFDAFRLAADNCDVLFASYPEGTQIEAHTHPTENVGIITRGELLLTRNNREERYSAGDWYHLDAGEEHAARFDVDTVEIEFWFRR